MKRHVNDEPTSSSTHLMQGITAESPAPRPRRWLQLGWLAAILLIAAQAPFILLYGRNLWRYRPHYEFFPFVLLVFIYLIWQRWPADADRFDRPHWLDFGLLTGGLFVLASSVVFFSPWLAAIAGVLTVGSLLVHFGGRPALRGLWPVWALLWLIVTPFRFDLVFIGKMQSVTSRASSKILDFLDIGHLRAGNIIELPGKQLFVAEACSGVHSQLVLITCSAIFVVLARRSPLRGGLLIAGAFAWATLMNVIRVTSVAVAEGKWQIDIYSGWIHEVLGFGLVGVGMLLVMSTDQLLSALLAPIPRGPTITAETSRNPLVWMWNRFLAGGTPDHDWEAEDLHDLYDDTFEDGAGQGRAAPQPAPVRNNFRGHRSSGLAIVTCSAFCLLGGLQVAILLSPGQESVDVDLASVAYDESSLPDKMLDWQRLGHVTTHRDRNSDEGECSQIWQYRAGSAVAHVSVDYPFMGWHELSDCYRGQGWHVDTRRNRVAEYPHQEAGGFVEVDLSMPGDYHALLLFSLFDSAGRPVTQYSYTSLPGLRKRIADNPLLRALGLHSTVASSTAVSMQVQQFLPTQTRLTEEEREKSIARFLQFRDKLRARWLEQRGG